MKTTATHKSNTKHEFARIPSIEAQRSQFDRSHGLKTTFDGGELIPILWDEALPGDTINCRLSSFARLATPIFPVMDNMYMDFFFFAVPYRLVWDNWQKFCGEQDDPGDSTSFLVPQVVSDLILSGDLQGFFGLPIGHQVDYNNLHLRAYNLIWNEWFRDENLQDQVVVDKDDGPDAAGDYNTILRRGKRHDYFTSCLPFTQKGTAVTLPIGSTAPVISTGDGIPLFDGAGWAAPRSLEGAAPAAVNANFSGTTAAGVGAAWDTTKLVADLSSATASTINDIRQAFQIQRLLERDARGGTRYVELLRSHFGVISPDQRLQRPEFLGGGSSRVNIHPVATTSDSGTSDIGDLASFGTQMVDGIGFVKSFVEHCLIIGLVNVRADLTYQNGVERMWSRQTRFDYYWPALSHIGEQAVLNKEIFWGDDANDDLTFGFQERYAEYRYKQSRVTGVFHSNAAGSLDAWHLAQDFATLPVLNDVFIQDTPPIDRVIKVPAEPHFIGDFYFKYICARPMPTFSVPGMIDHF